jgi:biopolymer transport protein ExbB/TolQ
VDNATHGLVQTLMGLPIFQAEWVLWLLLGLSLISIAVMIERWWFFRKRRIDVDLVRRELTMQLDKGDYNAAAESLSKYDSIETNVVLAGLREYTKGPEPVEDLIQGALGRERGRYEKRLNFLATLASNAPYIGLFGTVLGIIRSFKDLATSMSDASQSVMGGIAEALIATAVGLMVAIPAVVAFNYFKAKVKDAVTSTQFLARTLLSQLKAADVGRLE